jgi:hypothetical protein
MRYLIAATLVLVMMFGAACGGGDDDDGGSDGGNEPAATQGSDESSGESGDDRSSDDRDSSDDSDGSDGDSSGDFSSLAGVFGERDFVVTFNMETNAGGETLSGEWTWYRDVAGERARFDINTEAGGEAVSAIYITTAENTFFCTEGTCLAFPASAQSPFPDPSLALTGQVTDIEDRVLSGSVKDGGTRTIAGIEARCFTFDAPGSGIAEGESCVSSEGVPVLSVWESDEGSFRLEATSYSDQVSDDDFDPPFEVTQLPSN